MPPVCSSQSRERKHDLWCRGNRLLYTRDGLADISLVTENIQKMDMSCNIGIYSQLRDLCLLIMKCYVFMLLRNRSQRWPSFSLVIFVLHSFEHKKDFSTLQYTWILKKVTLSGEAFPYNPLWGAVTPGVGSQSLDFFAKSCLYCYRLAINNFGTCKKWREYNLSCMIYVFDTYV